MQSKGCSSIGAHGKATRTAVTTAAICESSIHVQSSMEPPPANHENLAEPSRAHYLLSDITTPCILLTPLLAGLSTIFQE